MKYYLEHPVKSEKTDIPPSYSINFYEEVEEYIKMTNKMDQQWELSTIVMINLCNTINGYGLNVGVLCGTPDLKKQNP